VKNIFSIIMVSGLAIFLIFAIVSLADGDLEKSFPGLNKSEVRAFRAINTDRNCEDVDAASQGCHELLDDVTEYTGAVDSMLYKFEPTSNYWAVVGMRNDSGSDWDLDLYSDSCGLGVNITWSWFYADTVEFVAIDYNHTPLGWEGLWVGHWSGGGGATVEFEDSTEVLTIGNNTGLDWPAGDVIEIWDLWLPAGTYDIVLETTAGTADLGLALFQSQGAEYYAARWEANEISNFEGPGGNESVTYTVVNEDWIGIVVWAKDGNQATFDINITTSTGIGDGPEAGLRIPKAFALNQNYPNPFNPSTTISFDLPGTAGTEQHVSLMIHDIRGRLVRILLDTQVEPGSHRVHWDGKNGNGMPVSSGIYLYTLKSGAEVSTRKMMIMK
jgi:hypothetical protein